MKILTFNNTTYNFNTIYTEEKFKDLIPRIEIGTSIMPNMEQFWKEYSSLHLQVHPTNTLSSQDYEEYLYNVIDNRSHWASLNTFYFEPKNILNFKSDSEYKWLLSNSMTFRTYNLIHLYYSRDQIIEILELLEQELK